MWDKTFLFLFILFIICGAFAYNQYLIENGEVSPVSKIIDFAGFAKFEDWKKSTTTTTEESFHFNKEEYLKRLREKHLALESQRNQLVVNRKTILNRLLEINTQFEDEAQRYTQVLDQEKEDFLTRFSELKDVGKELVYNHNEPDPVVKAENYLVIKNRLNDLLENVVENPSEDLPRLQNLQDKIEEVVTAEKDDWLEDCDGTLEECLTERMNVINDLLSDNIVSVNTCLESEVEDVEQCLRDNIDDVGDDLTMLLKVIVEWPERDLGKLQELTKSMEYEIKLLMSNSEATENKLKESSIEIESELKSLVEQLIKITEDDLRDYMLLYQELEYEQNLYLDNLALNRQRLYRKSEVIHGWIREIVEGLTKNPAIEFNGLKQAYGNLEHERVELLRKFEDNEKSIYKGLNDYRDTNKFLFNKLVEEKQYEFEKLMEDREYSKKKNIHNLEQQRKLKETIENKNKMIKRNVNDFQRSDYKLDSFDDSMRMREDRQSIQRQRSRDLGRQYEYLKDRVKDRGF